MPEFPLGTLTMTKGVSDYVSTPNADGVLDLAPCKAIGDAVARHMRGDWGVVCDEDKALNDEALVTGERLHSVYDLPDGKRVWVITEWDRSVTTVLFPEEY